MAYTLSQLLQEVLGDLGQSETVLATGGSTTTLVNAKVAQRRRNKPKTNYAVDGAIFVVATTDGLAPQGEMQRISAYDAATWTFTVDTAFSASLGAGDLVEIVTATVPLREAINRVNRALGKLVITLPDTSLTTVANQDAYTLPVAAKMRRPRYVEIQTVAGDEDTYSPRTDYDVTATAAGSTAQLKFRGGIGSAGMTIRLYYDTQHPALTIYSSTLHETVEPELALAAVKVAMLEWYVNSNQGRSDHWRQQLNVARADYDQAKIDYPIWRPKSSGRTSVMPMSGVC